MITAAVRAVRTIQYNNLLFYLLFIIYYSSDSPSSLITELLSITQSLSSLSSPSSSHRMSSSDPSKALLMQHFLKDLTITSNIQYYSISLPCRQGVFEGKVQIRTVNLFFRSRYRQKLAQIRFGCGLDSRIYGIMKHPSAHELILKKRVHQHSCLYPSIWPQCTIYSWMHYMLP